VSLVGNLGVLCFFKYYDFFVENAQDLFAAMGLDFPLYALRIVIPIGISFYTFQSLSYTIDVYRGTLKPTRSLLDFAVFVAFFPQLVAGPIVRAATFLPQMELWPRFDRVRLHDGLYRIGLGLVKKVVIADTLGTFIVDPVYANPGAYSPMIHLLAAYAFCFQGYNDFSGYTDLAIGTGRLFGFDLPENFITPFRSRSVREFWRRWHITLSSWVRDYVYFPLGGSRGGTLRVTLNLIVTMVIIGLWHGASWLWIVFGLVHGSVMAIERLRAERRGAPARDTPLRIAVTWLLTFNFIAFSLPLVRSDDPGTVWAMLTDFGSSTALSPWGFVALAAAFALHFIPDGWVRRVHNGLLSQPTLVAGALFGILVAIISLAVVGETPYIYFQF
jgi:D-alanyl-lipoteichoic acid acyltransferase DltB (MBOAT superfamily)